ncbi:hypothetical protein Bhyg_16633 [Pseudolycoriella hygida]|uniref:Uncharacterized protein n=1 Tax=Pseudolycoriella hygida TaxID=35572 RepID=A0A9Q0MIR8_9DIPT|nr:hypothetical protein Bhyg_16633 [Pseudolycoriella hygida]
MSQPEHQESIQHIDTIEPNTTKTCKMQESTIVFASDCNQSPPQTVTIQNCDKNLLLTKSTPIKGDVNTHDDAKSVLINRTKIGNEREECSIKTDDSDSSALTNNCDKSLDDSLSEVKSLPKPILNANGRGTLSKKSVSFDTDDEKIKKFINGDVIVDKQNPFRSENAKRREEFFRKSSEPPVIPAEDFVTTEDVLKESKYVKTYVKNPDLYFEYDPTLKQRLQKEEEEERKRNIPVRRSKFSRSTNERLKEIQSKFSPTTILYAQPKIFSSSSDEVDSRFLSRNRNRTKDKRYPDLSQIKVKVGTDIENSLFNPEEVALNALKFDARIKNSSFGSQDDLDDIADLTSTSVESVIENPSIEKCENGSCVEQQEEEQPKQTFTNTVSSKEFQEFLKKKGLTLLPESKRLQQQSNDTVNVSDLSIEGTAEMDSKKTKKPSVLQRLFPSRIFLSKRRTTPKQPIPEPKKLYTTLSDDEVNRTPGVKRVVLERQSYHAGNSSEPEYMKNLHYQKQMMDDGSSSISSALTNAESYVDMNVPVAKKRAENMENYIDMDTKKNDRGIEHYFQSPTSRKDDTESSKSSLGVRYIDSSSSNNTITNDTPQKSAPIGEKPIPKSRQYSSGRNSVPVMSPSERLEYHRNLYNNSAIPTSIKNRKDPVSFKANSADMNDGIIKPRVQRPLLSVDSKLSNKIVTANDEADIRPTNPPIPMKRNLERQSLNYKKPGSVESATYGSLNRTVSLDKSEIKRRNPPKPLERSKPVQSLAMNQKAIPTKSSNDRSPRTPNETFLGSPKCTSTPLGNSEQPQFKSNSKSANGDFYFHKKNESISPIVDEAQLNFLDRKLELNKYSWAKLRELKDETDRQLYNKPLVIQTDSTTQQRVYEGKVIDGRNAADFGLTQLQQNHLQTSQQQLNFQPRCQSALDNFSSRNTYGTIQNPGNPVILRKKPIGGMSREEIMSKVQEFCRKSMNNTPTKNLKGSVDQLNHRGGSYMNRTSSSEISPVSYTSLDSRATHSMSSSRSSAKFAPQVPQRVQSLQKDNPPTYAPVNKRGSIQSTNSDVFYTPVNRRVNQMPNHLTYSDSDSVFLPNQSNQTIVPTNQLRPSQRIVLLNSNQISPQQVITYQTPVPTRQIPEKIYTSRQNDIYGRVYPHNPTYGYIQGHASTPTQIYYTNTNTNQKRIGMDGRATPLILHAIHQPHTNGDHYGDGRSDAIVVLENVDEIYRPIMPNKVIVQPRLKTQNYVRSGNHIVPYESESCSEAEEVQRIMQNRENGEQEEEVLPKKITLSQT